MEREVCQYDKFGYCRYKDMCKKIHFSTECEDLDDCENLRTCQKRHPKRCKRYVTGKCRFENGCAYNHQKQPKAKDHDHLKEKVELLEKGVKKDNDNLKQKIEVLEKVTHALTRKVLSLEKELEDSKIKINTFHEITSGAKEKDIEMKENSSFHHSDIKERCSTPKGINDKGENIFTKSEMLICKECGYTCKKEKTLKNHILTKHDQHQCKECPEKLSNFMKLLKHVAEHHNKDQQAHDGRSEDEEIKNNDDMENVEDKQDESDKSFVFQKSMLVDKK